MEERKLTKTQILKGIGRLLIREARESPVTTTCLISLISCLPIVYSNSVRDTELKERVSIAADYNGNNDGATTDLEWQKVYKSLGLRYDSRNSRDLTLSEMERYLLAHSID